METPRKYDNLLARFLRYVEIDTQSQEEATRYPSTDKQLVLLNLLREEMKGLGLTDITTNAELSNLGYIKGRLPGNTGEKVAPVAFIAHVDTSPEESGAGVKPIVHRKYDGGTITFPANPDITLNPETAPVLAKKKGKTIITASGDTLLGADDKAGVAEIMTAVEFLSAHPGIKHGDIWVIFTSDEEVGNGTKTIRREDIAAKYAYTVDGGEEGLIETENFNATNGEILFKGFNTHPGSAKDKMVNAVRAASFYLAKLPPAKSPERTEGKEGFIHPLSINGDVNRVSIKVIIRDFTKTGLGESEELLQKVKEEVRREYGDIEIEIKLRRAYENMKEILVQYPAVIEAPFASARRLGITPQEAAIRGGTDGARLSFIGLPTPNLWTGGYMFHSKFEFAVLEEMETATALIIEIVRYFHEQTIS